MRFALGFANWSRVLGTDVAPNLRWSGPLRDKVPGARQGDVLMVVDSPRVLYQHAAAQLGR
jgi:hypothetical protein